MFRGIFLVSSLSAISTLIGVFLAFKLTKNKKATIFSFGFSAAVIIFLSFFDLLLKPLEYAEALLVFSFFISGGILIFFLDSWLPHFHTFADNKKGHFLQVSYLIALGLIIHDFPEGFSIATSYILEKNWGILVGLLVALHNVPEEFIIALPLIAGKKFKPLIIIAILSALAEPIGAIVGIVIVKTFHNDLAPLFTAFAGGAMMMIALTELLPLGFTNKLKGAFHWGFAVGAFSYFVLKIFV